MACDGAVTSDGLKKTKFLSLFIPQRDEYVAVDPISSMRNEFFPR